MRRVILTLWLTSILAVRLAQADSLILINGNEIQGRILEVGEEQVRFRLSAGETTISLKEVRRINWSDATGQANTLQAIKQAKSERNGERLCELLDDAYRESEETGDELLRFLIEKCPVEALDFAVKRWKDGRKVRAAKIFRDAVAYWGAEGVAHKIEEVAAGFDARILARDLGPVYATRDLLVADADMELLNDIIMNLRLRFHPVSLRVRHKYFKVLEQFEGLTHDLNQPCAVCGGSGNTTCPSCSGTGRGPTKIGYKTYKGLKRGMVTNIETQEETKCSRCGGSGKLRCAQCAKRDWEKARKRLGSMVDLKLIVERSKKVRQLIVSGEQDELKAEGLFLLMRIEKR